MDVPWQKKNAVAIYIQTINLISTHNMDLITSELQFQIICSWKKSIFIEESVELSTFCFIKQWYKNASKCILVVSGKA